MNVIELPAHIVLLPDVTAIVTEGVTVGVTFIVIPVEVAVGVFAHKALEVITQVTTAPFVKEVDVYVSLLVPAFVPSTFHW